MISILMSTTYELHLKKLGLSFGTCLITIVQYTKEMREKVLKADQGHPHCTGPRFNEEFSKNVFR